VARVENESVSLAMIACPCLKSDVKDEIGQLFIAVAGYGCFKVSLHDARIVPVLRRTDDVLSSVMAESYESAHTSHELSSTLREHFEMNIQPLQLDSQCKYSLLARGDASIYLRKPKTGYEEKIWDHAPGSLLVTEAGGRCTDFAGNPIAFKPQQTLSLLEGIVATMYTPEDHALIVEYLKQLE